MQVLCQKTEQNALLPKRAHAGDAGADLYANLKDPVRIAPGETVMVPAGFAGVIKEDLFSKIVAGFYGDGEKYAYAILICPRSGLAAKHSITVLNSPGIVDSGFTGIWNVILHNAGQKEYIVEPNDRIAQAVIVKTYLADFIEVDKLPETDRSSGGFGSTGK